jgi:type II secretory pathway pseudopilin PulG
MKSAGRRKKAKKNGYTLIQTLLCLLCAALVCSLICRLFSTLSKSGSAISEVSVQQELALMQLQEIVLLSNGYSVENGSLILSGREKEEKIVFEKNRLVKTPGYQILAEQIQDAKFTETDDGLYLEITGENGQLQVWKIA